MRVKYVEEKDALTIIEEVCEALVAGELIMFADDRAKIENVIEGLIALLDAVDGDPDREEDNEDCCIAAEDLGTPKSVEAGQ